MSFTTGIVALLFAAYVTFELSDILLSPMEFSFAIRSQQALSKSTENSTLTDDMSNLTIQVVPSTCTESSSTDAWITLPIRMFGTVCSGKVNIEQRNAYFARCSSIRQMDENICTKEELLSAKFYITESIRNVHLKDVDESSLHEPQWEDEKCHNVIEEVYYVVSDDEVSVQFKYTTVAASNATSFSQSFSVNHMREREEMRLILTRTVAGEKSFLSVPRGGNCLNFNRSKPVAWNVSTTTACSTPVESCIDLKQKLETVIDHYRPVTLTFGEDEVRVLTKNISSAKSNGCVLPSQVNIVVGVVNIEGNRSVNFFVWETVEAQMPAKATHWWLKFHMDFVTITPKPLYENHALFPTGPSVHSVTLAAPRMHMAEVEESEGIVPGGRQTLASSESCAQLQLPHSRSTKPEDDESVVRLEDEENGDGDLEPEVSDSKILEMLTSLPYHVFVLSAYGKPIFASAGHEDRMCPLFALVQAFVHKVESWKDNLCSIDAPNLHVRFSHRHPLILCIVSRSPFQLTNQLDVVYHQILSILSKTQLKKAYELRGENYDIRKLLRGSSDRSLYGCLRSWRADPAVFMSGVRVLPMAYSDREFIASTIASTVNAANLTDGVIFGIVLAHRQLVAYVRMKRYLLAPCDLHILINTVHGNSSFRNVEVWAPICLPRFNSQGFLHAHVSYLWDDSDAVLMLVSTARDQFFPLSTIRKEIVNKLNSSKHCSSIRESIQKPISFDLKQIGCPDLWHFIYNNTSSSQVCSSAFGKPFISKAERAYLIEQYNGLHSYVQKSDAQKHSVKTLFIVKSTCTVYVAINPSYELYCTFSPLVQRSSAVSCAEKLIKALKKEEGRFFYVVTSNFVN